MNIRSLQDYLPRVEKQYFKTENESESLIQSPKNFSLGNHEKRFQDHQNKIQSQLGNSLKVQIKHKLILHNEFQLRMLQQIQRLDVEKKVFENKRKMLNSKIQNMEYKKSLWEHVRQRYKSQHQQEQKKMNKLHQTLYDDCQQQDSVFRLRVNTQNSVETQRVRVQNPLDSKRYYANSKKIVYNQYKNDVKKLDKIKDIEIKEIGQQAKVFHFQKQRPFYKVSELKRKFKLLTISKDDSKINLVTQ